MSGYIVAFLFGAAFTFILMKITRGSAKGKDSLLNNADNAMIPASVGYTAGGAVKISAPLAAAITAAVYEYRKENT